MSMNNSCRFIGNFGKDPEQRFLQDGSSVVNFSLGVSKKWKDKDGNKQEKTEWPSFTIWGKASEVIAQYCSKGSKISVDAEYSLRKWQDKEGNDRYSPEFTVQQFELLGGGQNNGQNSGSGANSGRQQAGSNSNDPFPSHGGENASAAKKGNDPFAASPDFGDVPIDDDIPF